MDRTSYSFPVLKLGSYLWAGVLVPLSSLLMVVAVTVDGRLFAAAAILVGFLPIISLLACVAIDRRWRAVLVFLLFALVYCSISACVRSPSGRTSSRSRVKNIYADGRSTFRRYTIGNLLPEVDQLMLMFTLMPVVDSHFSQFQASRLKQWTAVIYHDLEADCDFHALGSTMPQAYDEALVGSCEHGHSFLYVPPGIDRSKSISAIVFLHGSGGNFKAYLWLLSRLADRLNMVVIAPTNGMGDWRLSETIDVVNAALAAASKQVNISPERIHLMGLSNGGLAVSQLASAQGSRYRSFIFLSPVFDVEMLRTVSFAQQCRERSVLILSGCDDDRVPIWYVEGNAADIAKAGGRVTVEAVEGADHFLLFSHRDQVLLVLEKWFRANDAALGNGR